MDNKDVSDAESKIPKEKSGIFDKFIDGFVNAFGSKYHFALATFGAIFVVYMIFQQGYGRWLLSTGLASNNYESAIEYFLAVATLYQSARILIKQTAQMLHLQRETDAIDELLSRNTTLTEGIHTLITENNRLTTLIHQHLVEGDKKEQATDETKPVIS